VSETSGTTAPLESLATPKIVAVGSCATAGRSIARKQNSPAITQNKFAERRAVILAIEYPPNCVMIRLELASILPSLTPASKNFGTGQPTYGDPPPYIFRRYEIPTDRHEIQSNVNGPSWATPESNGTLRRFLLQLLLF
jgi:hypothetical protein